MSEPVVTTQTYWDIEGVPLNNYAWNIETLGGGRLSVPPLRGSNLNVPYRRGEVFTPKKADSRDLTLAMWVAGRDDDGSPATGLVEASWQENLATLQALMWKEEETLTLTKRFWRNSAIVTASAEVQFLRGLEPAMSSPGFSRMTVTFRMPDPFFYGEVVEVALTDSGSPHTVAVAGDVVTDNILLDFDAGATLVNQAFTPNLSIVCNTAAVLNVKEKSIAGLSANAVVSSAGSDFWFALKPGNNTIVCENGDVDMDYRPAYF